jgi:TonB dependent receptor
MLLFVLAQAAAAVVAAAPGVAPPTAPVAAAAAPREGVTSYGAEFFASYRPANAAEMVSRLPGFTLDTGSSVRGYEGAAGNVLVDGQRPATKTDTLDQLLYRIPASSVDHIDVIRGGAPGIDMQGKTVIANVVRKAGGGFHGLLAYADSRLLEGRNYWAARAEGSGKIGDKSWDGGLFAGDGQDGSLGRGSLSKVDATGKPLEVGHIHAQGEATNVIANGALEQPLWGGRVRVNARVASQIYNSDETDFIHLPDTHSETDHQDDNVFQSEFGGRYTHSLGPRFSLETVLLRQNKHERYADNFQAPGDAEIFHQDTTTAESIARAVLKFEQTPTLSWEGGAEVAYNTLDNLIRFTQNGAAISLPAANVTVEEKRGELFGKAVWRLTPKLTVEGGLRQEGSNISSSGDVNLQKTLYFTKPRVLLTWSPDADTQVRVRFERAVGQLDFGAFVASTSLTSGTVTAGNPNLVPEQDWVSEAAFERRFWTKGSLVVTLRHSQITDVVDTALFFGFEAPANIGAGSKDEEIVSLTLPLDRLGLKGAQIQGLSTWRQSEVTDPTTRRPREITALHPNDWELHFTQDLPAHRLNWGIDVFGQQRERYFRSTEVDTYKYGTFVSPFIEWKPRADLAVRVELDNASHRPFKREFDHYAGTRDAAALASTLVRKEYPSQVFYIRLRKMFGT